MLYWALNSCRLNIQNLFLVFVSYFFYALWDYRFLSLVIISSGTDFLIGKKLKNTESHQNRKKLLLISITVNIGILFVFKYFGFFVESFSEFIILFGINPNIPTLNIVLPVGISFYTFQTLSYTVDVYKKKIEPCTDVIVFFAFVCFFPQLVAGPIERAKHFLIQFATQRKFHIADAKDGARQILWGLFKKTVVADNLSVFVEMAFSGNPELNGLDLIVGAVCFSVQIYCDFSGYTDIAIGSAKLLGFKLNKNFDNPYFSRNIIEFWQRWHISLSTWFRDYVYIPLGGNRVSLVKWVLIVCATLVVSGLWHGANWTFVVWGGIHAVFYIGTKLILVGQDDYKNIPLAKDNIFPSLKEIISILTTFTLVTFAWVFFRAESIPSAIEFFYVLVTGSWSNVSFPVCKIGIICLILFFVEWNHRHRLHGFEISYLPLYARWAAYYLVLAIMLKVGVYNSTPFIYFQF